MSHYDGYVWLVTVFSDEDNELVAKYPINELSLEEARKLFDRTDDDDMLDVYPITQKIAGIIGEKADIIIDTEAFSYFAELEFRENIP